MKKSEHKAIVLELENQLADVSKKLESAESMKNHYSKNAQEAEKVVEELHCFLDALPDILERKSGECYSAITYSPMTRLASWMAKALDKRLN